MGQDSEKLRIYNDSITLIFIKQPFLLSDHHIVSDTTDGFNFVTEIDGKKPSGIDGNIPRHEYQAIFYIKEGDTLKVDSKAFSDLYEPNLDCFNDSINFDCYTRAVVSNFGEVIVEMKNGDAAGSYTAFMVFESDTLSLRAITRDTGHQI